MKAGDLLFSKSSNWSSRIVRGATQGKWSHVAIALNETEVLEAVPGRIFSKRYVRCIELKDFIDEHGSVSLLVRPSSLTSVQQRNLDRFAKQAKKYFYYTLIHAGLSALPNALIFIFCIIFPIIAAFCQPNTAYISFIYGCLVAYTLTLSSRTTFGVKQTEMFFRRYRCLRYLVALKKQAFCSKLVYKADIKVGGTFQDQIKHLSEVTPQSLYSICQNEHWKEITLL